MYTDTHCADMTFGISRQAMAVGHMLASFEPDFGGGEMVRTWLWHNGRERGLVVGLRKIANSNAEYLWAFAENRNSDAIFVEEWKQAPVFNQPTLESRRKALGDDASEQLYRTRKYFQWGECGAAALHIFRRMEHVFKTQLTVPPSSSDPSAG